VSGPRPQPRNDDELFADIVAREFHEDVRPAPVPTPPAPPTVAPEPFELNLFDDDESYRDVPHVALRRLSPIARVGFILLAVSVVGGMLLMIGVGAPRWVGWLVAVGFGVAVAIGIRQLLRRHPPDDDGAEL
jgi:hypothetical protein